MYRSQPKQDTHRCQNHRLPSRTGAGFWLVWLQVQERLTIQIANALMTHLEPKAAGVVIRCRHTCLESRGIRNQGEETITSAMLGEPLPNLAPRTELLALARAA